MGTKTTNADGTVLHFGTRALSNEGTLQDISISRRRGQIEYFEDFLTLEADFVAGFTSLSGTDGQAVKALQTDVPNGVYRLTSGDADGTTAADGEQLVMATPVNASSGGLWCEARIKCVTNTSTMSMGFGFTDSTSLEEAFTVSGTTVTSTATDAVMFTYDTAATTAQWYCLGVDTDVDATGNALSGVAPSTSWQTLRIEIDAQGYSAKFFINGAKVGEVLNAVTPTIDLFATVYVCSTTTTSKAIDVDYIAVGYNRA